MKKQRISAGLVFLFVAAVCVSAQSAGPGATSVRVEIEQNGIYGPLFVTIAGTEKKVAGEAQRAWIINDGRHVVYSSSQGAGGYENEGQGLHVYDIATGKQKRVMSEYFMVDDVKEVVTSTKKRALLVKLSDGGLGAEYVAVVDPARGEVFFRGWTRILSQKDDTIVLGFYREGDWEKLNSGDEGKVRPYKRETHNLNSILKRRVIFKKRRGPLE